MSAQLIAQNTKFTYEACYSMNLSILLEKLIALPTLRSLCIISSDLYYPHENSVVAGFRLKFIPSKATEHHVILLQVESISICKFRFVI